MDKQITNKTRKINMKDNNVEKIFKKGNKDNKINGTTTPAQKMINTTETTISLKEKAFLLTSLKKTVIQLSNANNLREKSDSLKAEIT